MRATVFRGPFDVRIEQVPDAALREPTDALVRITHACICGSDLWPYRGLEPFPPGGRLGHEWMGITEQLSGHLMRAKDNGLTEAELKEVITHLAFYAGWPKAMSAIAVAKHVFGKQ
jgi:carboxymuconolactone decarboxylase family protein/alcohol dehydrogenase-like protein